MPSGPASVSFRALMTKVPPSRSAFAVRLVYVSSSLLPQPLPPISKDHLPESTAEPLGPSNSSLHTRLQTAGLPAFAVGEAIKSKAGIAANRTVESAPRSAVLINDLLLG